MAKKSTGRHHTGAKILPIKETERNNISKSISMLLLSLMCSPIFCIARWIAAFAKWDFICQAWGRAANAFEVLPSCHKFSLVTPQLPQHAQIHLCNRKNKSIPMYDWIHTMCWNMDIRWADTAAKKHSLFFTWASKANTDQCPQWFMSSSNSYQDCMCDCMYVQGASVSLSHCLSPSWELTKDTGLHTIQGNDSVELRLDARWCVIPVDCEDVIKRENKKQNWLSIVRYVCVCVLLWSCFYLHWKLEDSHMSVCVRQVWYSHVNFSVILLPTHRTFCSHLSVCHFLP